MLTGIPTIFSMSFILFVILLHRFLLPRSIFARFFAHPARPVHAILLPITFHFTIDAGRCLISACSISSAVVDILDYIACLSFLSFIPLISL